jgi:hypothetical protein
MTCAGVALMHRLKIVVTVMMGMYFCIPWIVAQEPLKAGIQTVDFSLQIRPILSEHCFHCHGPDESHRQADLRLDDEASAKERREGKHAVHAGAIHLSQIIERIESTDPDLVMPPPSARKTVTPQQRELLKRWIEQGAKWGKHWSLEPPKRVATTSTSVISGNGNSGNDNWANTPIDALVLQAMQRQGLEPAPASNPYTLVRRLWLDLVGLHPDPVRVERFIAEYQLDRKQAIASMVEELLEHPGFGEHWARLWLDLARYADTKGYEKDLKRDLWPYRDWVIQALNADMPYDQFTIEQLAGDLLENPSSSQRIATAFHRATLSNDEGGTDDEEYRVAAVKDRVDTTLQVWMGLTMGCAKCHSHKYDPISIEDYYSFYAIFNQTEDADRYDDEPRLPIPSFAQQSKLASLQNQREQFAMQLDRARLEAQKSVDERWLIPKPIAVSAESQAPLEIQPDQSIRALAERPATDVYQVDLQIEPGQYQFLKLDALMAKTKDSDPAPRLSLNANDPNFVINDLQLFEVTTEGERRIAMKSLKASFEQNGWPLQGAVDDDPKTGWAISPKQQQAHWGIFEFAEPIQATSLQVLRLKIVQSFGNHLLLHRFKLALAKPKENPLSVDDVESVKQLAANVQGVDKEIQTLKDSVPKLPILKDLAANAKRKTQIHKRGSFLDPGQEVSASLLPLFDTGPKNSGADRLAAARWIVDPSNPLTARVAVNRVWAQLFGRGIVETEEDFGATGSLPSHPELLDWLAIEYRDSLQWSLKGLIRTIVLSNTYQQSYVMDELRQRKDPRNIWLSRAPHFRLSAEVVRDQALGASGLLSKKLGGPPVMPPQPEGLWRSTYSGAKWVTSQGEDRFRRGLYTFWKRTTPYPSMEIFDGTTREVCQIRRITTNTPLQALVTLNDPVYVEASIAMARDWLSRSQSEPEAIRKGFAAVLVRPIEPSELDRLQKLLATARKYYRENPEAAKAFLADYPLEIDSKVDLQELAAWSTVTSTLLNLDEFLTRP